MIGITQSWNRQQNGGASYVFMLALHAIIFMNSSKSNYFATASKKVIFPQRNVVSASEGGWPASLVGEPFSYKESLYCHTKPPPNNIVDSSSSSFAPPPPCEKGFDWHCASPTTKRCYYDSTRNDTHIDLKCPYDDENEKAFYHIDVPSKCCERFLENDISIYKTEKGLHYTSMHDLTPMTRSLEIMERDYPDFEFDGTVLLLYYGYRDNVAMKYHEIPDRIYRSTGRYNDVYRCISRPITFSVDNKIQHARRVTKLQQDMKGKSLPFPKTYLTCKAALAAESATPDTIYYVKKAEGSRGEGIQVVTHQQLQDMQLKRKCRNSLNVIQEAVTDLATISNKRFDIRFYMLTHNGKIYLHQHALLIYLENAPGSIFDPKNPASMQLSATRELGKKGAVIRSYSNEQPELWSTWIDAIAKGLADGMPAFDRVLEVSRADPHLYQIWGGDAMIRSNGEVVFPEFNDWPDILYGRKTKNKKSKLLNLTEVGPVERGDFEEFYYDFVGQMFADFYSIVLGVATDDDRRRHQNDDGSTSLCNGRVTEVMPHQECEA